MGKLKMGGAIWFFPACLSTLAVAATPSRVPGLDELAGRYTRTVSGYSVAAEAPYRSTDAIKIVRLGRDRARINVALNFDNGHTCSLSGGARMEGGRLVHRESNGDNSLCVFTLWRDGDRLRWSDGDNSCIRNCGMRGSLGGGEMPFDSKGPAQPPRSNVRAK